MAKIELELDLEDLPYELADQCTHRTLLKFIADIDEQVCERSFTEKLIERLTMTLEEGE
jgi:phage tail tube protein FII